MPRVEGRIRILKQVQGLGCCLAQMYLSADKNYYDFQILEL